MRAVLDVNILISGLLTPKGVSGEIIKRGVAGEFEIIVSPLLLQEFERVLRRPWIQELRLPTLHEIVSWLSASATFVVDRTLEHQAIPADSDDVYLLDLAVATASLLVSGDRDVLALADTALVLSARAFLDFLDGEQPTFFEGTPTQFGSGSPEGRLDAARRATLKESVVLL